MGNGWVNIRTGTVNSGERARTGTIATMAGHSKTLNPRQLVFAQAIASGGMSQTEAAKRAGYAQTERLRTTASNLANSPMVKAEVERLRTQARATLQLDADTWRNQLIAQYQEAVAAQDRSVTVRYFELWGKHLGLLDTKADSANAALATQLMAHLAALSDVAPVLDAVEGEYRALPGT